MSIKSSFTRSAKLLTQTRALTMAAMLVALHVALSSVRVQITPELRLSIGFITQAAADCTAYSRADFHARFMQDKVTLIGCPKLDSVDYSEKLAEMFSSNDIASITVVRMQVPCCGGITAAVERAIAASGKRIPMRVVILSTDGRIIRDETV